MSALPRLGCSTVIASPLARSRSTSCCARSGGGELRHGDVALELGGLEFALLRALVERAQRAPDPALAFLSTDELARMLRFRSDSADQENVRELIRRVRRKLQSIGIDGLIDSRRHADYRLGWAVSAR
jgi:DNA-binding response OmpR family regulator